MKTFEIFPETKKTILALGPESAGNFSVFRGGKIFFSDSFGDLLEEKNFQKFKKAVLDFLKKNKIKPGVILTDLHPFYKTTALGQELSQKFKAKHILVQHHLAHIFSAIGDKIMNEKCGLRDTFGIALDGTGYGHDGKIWGGEIFKISNSSNCLISNKIPRFKIERVGKLENQVLIGGDLAVREPARMFISILSSFLDKEETYHFAKKHYSKNEFELLYNQLKSGFNCIQTSSAGRILDAVSLLLGFAKNERKYKHEPIDLLEKNSTEPYLDLKPKIKKTKDYELLTAPLFQYLIKNLRKNKKRLAATAQLYIAKGLYEIISNFLPRRKAITQNDIFLAGGIGNNKIISSYLESEGAYVSKKIPRGDAGLSFGQVIYYLLTNARD